MNEKITDLDKRYKNKQNFDVACRIYKNVYEQLIGIYDIVTKLEKIVSLHMNVQPLAETVLCENDILNGGE